MSVSLLRKKTSLKYSLTTFNLLQSYTNHEYVVKNICIFPWNLVFISVLDAPLKITGISVYKLK